MDQTLGHFTILFLGKFLKKRVVFFPQAGEADVPAEGAGGAGALATSPVDGKPAAIFAFYVPRTTRSRKMFSIFDFDFAFVWC